MGENYINSIKLFINEKNLLRKKDLAYQINVQSDTFKYSKKQI